MKLSRHHYIADAVLIWCFDNRFSPALRECFKKNNIKHYDLISVAGGAKNLSSPEDISQKEFLIDQLKKSAKLHHAKKIVLMTHSDCGAYGGLKHFGGSASKEKSFHKKELTSAKKVIKNIPELKKIPIELVFADFRRLLSFRPSLSSRVQAGDPFL